MATYLLTPSAADQIVSLLQWMELDAILKVEDRTISFSNKDLKALLPSGQYCEVGNKSYIRTMIHVCTIEPIPMELGIQYWGTWEDGYYIWEDEFPYLIELIPGMCKAGDNCLWKDRHMFMSSFPIEEILQDYGIPYSGSWLDKYTIHKHSYSKLLNIPELYDEKQEEYLICEVGKHLSLPKGRIKQVMDKYQLRNIVFWEGKKECTYIIMEKDGIEYQIDVLMAPKIYQRVEGQWVLWRKLHYYTLQEE